jgi:ribosomal protein S3AE
MAFTARQREQVKANCYAQTAQIRKIRRKMTEIMTQDVAVG